MFRSTVALAFLGTVAVALAVPPERKSPSEKDTLFRSQQVALFRGPLCELHFEISAENMQALRDDPRRYVEARFVSGGRTFKGAAVKLKGADGSFKPVDQKPALTIHLDKFKGAERFRGLKKFHLNNANEDPSFLRQMICGEMARAAGVPAVRATHALVKLNGRDLGLYVLTEGYTKDFFAQFFRDPTGDVYESGFCKDIDVDLQKDEGDTDDFRAIEQLIAATREEDDAARWRKLSAVLETGRFASFLAMEALMGVGDSYNFFRNNYRIYHDPITRRLSFIPHGMDQPLGDVDFPIQRSPESLVGRAFVGCPEGRALYRERVGLLFEKVFRSRDWPARIAEVADDLTKGVARHDPQLAKEIAPRMEELRGLVTERIKSIARQLSELPEPLVFDSAGVARISRNWGTKYETGAQLEEVKFDGKNCLRIIAERETQASWRRGVELPAGRYRLEVQMKTRGVEGAGVGLRISGEEPAVEWTRGDADWANQAFAFTVGGEGRDVVLVAELRGTTGEAWFAVDSLRLVRLP